MALIPTQARCPCRRNSVAPLRMESTFLAFLHGLQVPIPAEAVLGTWQCSHCRAIHPLRARDLHLGSTGGNPLRHAADRGNLQA